MPRTTRVLMIAVLLTVTAVVLTTAAQTAVTRTAPPARPQGPCDIYVRRR
jgi:hypothetical protein